MSTNLDEIMDEDIDELTDFDMFEIMTQTDEMEYRSEDSSDDDDDDDDIEDEIVEVVQDADITPVKRGRGRPKKGDPVQVRVGVKTSSQSNIDALSFANRLGTLTFTNDMFTKNEFGKLDVVYKKVLDPTGKETDYFSSHCNVIGCNDDNGNPIYRTSTQLSKNYILIDMEDLINSVIKNSITFQNETIHTAPFLCTWAGNTTKQLTTINSQLEKDMFLIYSGFDSNKLFSIKNSNIDIYISNSYDGKSAIFMSFVLSVMMEDEDGNEKEFKDFFSLRETKNKFLHKGIQVSDIQDALLNIDNSIDDDIDVMKQYKLSEDDIDKICKKLRNKKGDDFKNKLDSMPSKYDNVYFSLLMLSTLVQDNYDTFEHFNLQPIVNKIVDGIFKDHEKTQAALAVTI